MTKPTHSDPIDALGAAYEKMYERAAENLHSTEKKSAQLLHKLIDEAKDKAVELKELSEDDAAKLADWLKRDLDDAISHIAETDEKLTDWLGFETTLIESALLYLLLETADKTTVELLQMKQNAERPYIYHTGEVTGPGMLICDQCGEVLHFHKAGRIPPCPRCHETQFHREGKKVTQE